ncbi:hypothetical protein PILCRDRAFT_236452 [Piloderma croceum F 1598]|uniref:Uncharacterized protein n=1 Tax=Piloderma croceum (strain F 1598) TaxID=765440 RepID=A0A0C3FWZ9_PILCF|nr:hypothetical protein PILCRDRAFT_236452 [Piloderma croceum F 1598]
MRHPERQSGRRSWRELTRGNSKLLVHLPALVRCLCTPFIIERALGYTLSWAPDFYLYLFIPWAIVIYSSLSRCNVKRSTACCSFRTALSLYTRWAILAGALQSEHSLWYLTLWMLIPPRMRRMDCSQGIAASLSSYSHFHLTLVYHISTGRPFILPPLFTLFRPVSRPDDLSSYRPFSPLSGRRHRMLKVEATLGTFRKQSSKAKFMPKQLLVHMDR